MVVDSGSSVVENCSCQFCFHEDGLADLLIVKKIHGKSSRHSNSGPLEVHLLPCRNSMARAVSVVNSRHNGTGRDTGRPYGIPGNVHKPTHRTSPRERSWEPTLIPSSPASDSDSESETQGGTPSSFRRFMMKRRKERLESVIKACYRSVFGLTGTGSSRLAHRYRL